jgi:ER-derived vesicles protein
MIAFDRTWSILLMANIVFFYFSSQSHIKSFGSHVSYLGKMKLYFLLVDKKENVRFFLFCFSSRSCSLVGGLILLMVENRKEARTLFAGVPTIHNNAPKNYMQLTGRLLLVIMFITIVRFEPTVVSAIQNIIGGLLILFVAIGFKTKLSALLLVTFLILANFYANCFWTVREHKALHDFLKYDFFQTMSVVGGLLYVVALGPGGVSIDARKKEW